MAKEIVVIGVEEDALTGVRMTLGSSGWARAEASRFVLTDFVAAKKDEEAEETGDANGSPGDRPLPEGGAESEAGEQESPLVAAFCAVRKHFNVRECALALPLTRFLTTMTQVPVAERDDLADLAAAALAKGSPFPDEELTAGIEVAAETDRALSVLAAALPESTGAEIGAALRAAKLCVTRTDVLALGWLRALWPRVLGEKGTEGRKIVLLRTGGMWNLIVLQDGAIAFVRGLGKPESAAAFGRDVTLSVLALPGGEVKDVAVLATEQPAGDVMERLGAFGPVRFEAIEDKALGAEGCALRETEESAFDATPAAWRQALRDTRFKRKLMAITGAALGVWLLVMGVLFGVPFAYDRMTAYDAGICRKHAKQYARVKDTKQRVELVQKYSDHARGALEMLRLVSNSLPEGLTLTSFQYTRKAEVLIYGEAEMDRKDEVYTFSETLRKSEIFEDVELTGPQQLRQKGKSGWKFEIKAAFPDLTAAAEAAAPVGKKGGKGGKAK